VTNTPTNTPTAAVVLAPVNLQLPVNQQSGAVPTGTVTVTNNGPGPVTISDVSVGGADPSAFMPNGCKGTTLQPASSCAITITFNTSTADPGDSQGNYNATLKVSEAANGSNGTSQTAPLGTGPRTFTLQADGSTSIPAGQSAQFTLKNYGPGPLPITSITTTMPGSQATGCTVTLAAGASCGITVTFIPQPSSFNSGGVVNGDAAVAQGSYASGSLTATAAGSPGSISIPITGVVPTFTLSPISYTNPNRFCSDCDETPPPPATAVFTVSVVGQGELFGITYFLSNTNGWTINSGASTCPQNSSTVGVTGSCTITVTVAPLDNSTCSPAASSLRVSAINGSGSADLLEPSCG
jgi:hypothetical protein